MKICRQPNRWSCLPASFATVLDRSFDEIIKAIGHDGSLIERPLLDEPLNRKGFHIQELISVVWNLGYAVTPFEPNPMISADGVTSNRIIFPEGNDGRACTILAENSAVLTGLSDAGRHHAVAWDSETNRIYNPDGRIQALTTFAINTIWVITSR